MTYTKTQAVTNTLKSRRNFLSGVGIFMLLSSAPYIADSIRPKKRLVEKLGEIGLSRNIPSAFGSWSEVRMPAAIVNPQQEELINYLYQETLSRAYTSDSKNIVLISIAYGASQKDGVSVHIPDICYPAQGFEVLEKVSSAIQVGNKYLRVKRLTTKNGSRIEVVNYWVVTGEKQTFGQIEKKRVEISYALEGYIPDGLVFRTSMIVRDLSEVDKANLIQYQFIQELYNHTEVGSVHRRIFGI